MQVDYADDALRRLAYEPGYLHPHLDADTTKVFHRKMQIVMAAPYADDLRNLRSLGLSESDQDGQVLISLDERFGLLLSLRAEGEPLARILNLVDNNVREVSR